MDGLTRDVGRLEAEAQAKDERIGELEIAVDRLKGAVASYGRDMGELESLVQRMEGDLGAKNGEMATLESGHGELKETLKARDDAISDKEAALTELEGKLAAAMQQTDGLGAELALAQDKHKATVGSLNRAHGQALALRDARVSELRGEIDRVNEALRAAHDAIRQLRVGNSNLTSRLAEEKAKAKAAIDAVKAELERVGQEVLSTPRKERRRSGGDEAATVVRPGALLAGNLARRSSDGKGKKRRRYDSGLGFLDEEEIEADV